MRKDVYLLANANNRVGFGHFSRILALQDILENDFNLTIVSGELPSFLKEQINDPSRVILAETIEEKVQALDPAAIAVFDDYTFTPLFQKEAKQRCRKLVCIDDLAAGEYFADVIINHAAGVNPGDYKKQDYTRVCIGADYALVRKFFFEKGAEERKGVYVSMGGADPGLLLKHYSMLALKIDRAEKVYVFASRIHPSFKELNELSKQNDRLEIKTDLPAFEVAKVMRKCFIGFAPCSVSSYELCAANVPFFGILTAENQRFIHDFLHNEGLMLSLKEEDLLTAFTEKDLLKVSAKQAELFDGRARNNILALFKSL